MSEIKFIPGLFAKAPNEKAPDFVKGSISIKRVELMEYLAGLSDEWVNIDIKESRGGKWYCAINDWKPEKSQSASSSTEKPTNRDSGGFVDDSIPFAQFEKGTVV